MNFVSYAQNFEDVMLWRALKHVGQGFYVDIGAQHPVVDSVSKAFYEHGWRGVHIEPVQAYADLLRQDRPADTVLQLALSDSEGVLELNVIPDTGLSTGVAAYAQRHVAEHGFAHTTVSVPMSTMKSALRFVEGREVHWLKIDVEGLEEKVLRGWDSERLRPWIMVVEATVPTSPEADYEGWEHIVTGAGYRFAYFDGLNRFYVADEHAELLAAFDSPPNVFDAAQLSGLASSELCRGVLARHQHELAAERERIASLEAEAASLRELGRLPAHIEWLQGQLDAALGERGRLQGHIDWMQGVHEAAQSEVGRLHGHIAWMQGQLDAALRSSADLSGSTEALRRQIADIHASTSWRITSPMRRAVNLARRVKRVLRRLVRGPVPPAQAPAAAAPVADDEATLRELSPRAARILAEIQQVLDSKAD
jgi:FkbM family methyltransferase